MARIAGIDIPKNKRGCISLTYVYGIGRSKAIQVLDLAGVSHDAKVNEWTEENIAAINRIVSDVCLTEGELRSTTQLNIKRLQDIACYRGIRHRKGLPSRGQKTKTNARTRKGKKKTVAGKKKVTK
jgi:small subunit ribosomal protein S13